MLLDVESAWFAGVKRKIVSARPTAGGVLLTVEGVTDRDAADALRGQKIEVPRGAIEMAEGEYLLADLPGCEVVDEAGAPLGKVVEVMMGAQDLLVIHNETEERLLPLVPEFVLSVDVVAKKVTVTLPEDLPVTPVVPARPVRPARPGPPAKSRP